MNKHFLKNGTPEVGRNLLGKDVTHLPAIIIEVHIIKEAASLNIETSKSLDNY